MADLKGQQLNQRYQTLLTTSVTTADPKTGILQNGDGSDILELTIDAGANANNTLTIDKSDASGGNALILQGAAGNINFAHTGQAITFSTAGTITATGSNDLNLVSGQRVAVDATHSDGLYVDANITCTSNISAGLSFLSLGSASAPSYSFTGDTNTGMFSSGADAIRLVTGGTSRLAIDSSGNVGIGTNLPASGGANTQNVHIHNPTANSTFLKLSTSGTGSSSSDGLDLAIDNSGNSYFINRENANIHFYTNGDEKLRIEADGDIAFYDDANNQGLFWDASTARLGLGTQTPDYKLQINGSGTVARFTNGTSHMDFYSGSGLNEIATVSPLLLSVGGTERLRIDSSGNVGIGETNPTLGKLVVKDNYIVQTDGTRNVYFGSDGTGGLIGTTTNHYTRFITNNDEKMRIDSSGNVGIGTDSPVNNTPLTLQAPSGYTDTLWLKSVGTNIASRINIGPTGTGNAQINNATGTNIEFQVGGSEKVRIDSSGNVGIGTTDPDEPIHVAKSTGDAIIAVEANNGNAALYLTSAGSGKDNRIVLGNAKDLKFEAQAAGSGQGQGQDPTATATTVMTLTNGGNLALGTNTPIEVSSTANWLTLDSDSGSSVSGGIVHAIDGTSKAVQYIFGSNVLYDAKSGVGHKFTVNNGTDSMLLDTSGNVLVGKTTSSLTTVGVELKADGNLIATRAGVVTSLNREDSDGTIVDLRKDGTSVGQIGAIAGLLTLGSNNNVALTFTSSSIRPSNNDGSGRDNAIDLGQSGNRFKDLYLSGASYIGATGAPNGTSIYGSAFIDGGSGLRQLFQATSTATTVSVQRFYNPNGNVGSIQLSGSATSFVTSSDYRLKENVVEMTGALDRVDQLKPSRFNFIADADTTVDGFLAHEVADVVPEAITGEKDATEEYEVTPAVLDDEGNVIEEAVMGTRPVYQGIDQSKLVPLLVGAIQELRAEIEQLKNQ